MTKKRKANTEDERTCESTFSLLRPEQRKNELSLFKRLTRGLSKALVESDEDFIDESDGSVHIPRPRKE